MNMPIYRQLQSEAGCWNSFFPDSGACYKVNILKFLIMIKVKRWIMPAMIVALVMTGCKTRTDSEQEVEKLLERQTQIQEAQEASVEELERIRDSLDRQEDSLLSERETRTRHITRLQQNQQILAERLRQEEQSDISSEKEELQGQIAAYEDSIATIQTEIASLNSTLDSIDRTLRFYNMQEERTEETLASGISEIDQQITRRENLQRQELERAELLRKQLVVADEKIEAFQLERQLYEDERDELLRKNASGEKLEPFRNKIAEVDSVIGDVRTDKQSIQNELDQLLISIAETDEMIERLHGQIDQQYDRKDIMEGFIVGEKERLQRELDNLRTSRRQMIARQEKINRSLSGTEEQLASLDRRMELVRNREMSEILEEQAALARTEAGLAEEEARQLRESGDTLFQARPVPDTADRELLALAGMSAELDSLQALIQEEKAQIAETRMELAERRAEAASQRARFGRTVGIVVAVIILGGIALLALFYYLGRRTRQAGK